MRWPLLAVALAGCQPEAADDALAGPYFRLVGDVDPDVSTDGSYVHAAIAWVWVVEGTIGGRVQPVAFEPGLNGYAVEVRAPPEATSDGPPAPDGFGAAPALLWGLPVWLAADGPAPLRAEVDAPALLAWAASEGPHDGLLRVHGPPSGRVVGYTPGYLLAAMEATGELPRLGLAEGWEEGGPWCAFDDIVAGLTLYGAPDAPCDGWRPLAAPGERTEFQGITMRPW